MIAALTRVFGPHNLPLAEDVVQDAFASALAVWPLRGVPDNPSAWLMTVARNRALDIVRRERTAERFAPEVARLLESEWTRGPVIEEAFAAESIRDEQLRMMFSCCHPQLAEEAQVALILNILCGMGAAEIAAVFLAGRAAIEKRIARGKKVLAGSRRLFALTERDFPPRLAAVRRALYLLFSEGYHGAAPDAAVRAELCAEAIRLIRLLREYPPAASPETNALAALMCLHAARLPGRLDAGGELSPFADQDRSRWDATLLAEGLALFEASAAGTHLTAYHVEAAIAATHAAARRFEDTDWSTIVALYDRLLEIAPSPVVGLNRAFALGQRDGPERGLAELRALPGRERLAAYPFYPAAIAELELRRGERASAREHFVAAIALARNPTERHFLENRLKSC